MEAYADGFGYQLITSSVPAKIKRCVVPLHCPNDFSVVRFDDVQTHEVQALNLTTYRTPYNAIAKTAIELLHTVGEPKSIQLFGEVVERSSIRNIRDNHSGRRRMKD